MMVKETSEKNKGTLRQRFVSIGFVLAMVILAVVGSASFRNTSRLIEATEWTEHTHRVQLALDTLLTHLVDAETGQRGYLLTGLDHYLEPYELAIKKIGEEVSTIRYLTRDNPHQQKRMDPLKKLINEKLQELEETVSAQRNTGSEAAIAIVMSDRGKILMDAIREIVREMSDEEIELMDRREAAVHQQSRRTSILMICGNVLSASLLLFVFLLLRSEIKERKEAEIRIQEATRVKSEFTSMVSHELRTPLTAIKDSVDIVFDGSKGPLVEGQKKYLSMAKRNIDRLSRLIHNVLDYQKLEASKMELHKLPEDLNQIIRETMQVFMPAIQKAGLVFRGDYTELIPPVSCDKDKIVQVVSNILSNAIKFTKEGEIVACTEHGEGWVKVSVTDQGTGIREEDQPKLFEAFRQLDSDGIRSTGGTGLGLAISRKIVEAHGGKMGLESTFGRGSTFFFILPIEERRRG